MISRHRRFPRTWSGRKFWRKCQAASNASGNFRQLHLFTGFSRPGDGDHGAHGGDPVIDIRSTLRTALQSGICEIFELQLVRVSILAERPMKLPVLGGKAFDLARLMKPGQKDFAVDAAVLAIDAEPFLKI